MTRRLPISQRRTAGVLYNTYVWVSSRLGSFRTCRPVIATFSENQKKPLVLSFSDVATNFSPEIQVSIISFRSQSESFYLQKSDPLKNASFVPGITILMVQKTLKRAMIFDLSRYSNSSFSETTRLTSSINISIKILRFLEDDSIKTKNFDNRIRTLIV